MRGSNNVIKCFGLILVMMTIPLTARSQWLKIYGGDGSDRGYSVDVCQDGGYIIAGRTMSFGAGGEDVYVLRTDEAGDTSWCRTYGGPGEDRGCCVRQTMDGGYVIAGYTSSFGAGEMDVYLLKLDAWGDSVWTKTYGTEGYEEGRWLDATPDGGYVIVGYTTSGGAGGQDMYVVKTDSAGALEWSQTYGDSLAEQAYCITSASEGGYVVAGYTKSHGVGADNLYLVEIDEDGVELWSRAYGGSSPQRAHSICATTDGGYAVAGYKGMKKVYLVRLDAAGDSLWTRTYGGSGDDIGWSVWETSDGGFVVAGETESFGAGDFDGWLIKTDASGDSSWSRTYGMHNTETFYQVLQTPDGGYITTGRTRSYGDGPCDVYVVKTDEQGTIGIEETPRGSPLVLRVSQSIFRDQIALSYELNTSAHVHISVYDPLGRKVRTFSEQFRHAGSYTTAWDGTDFSGKMSPSGVYFVRFEAGEGNRTARIVKIR